MSKNTHTLTLAERIDTLIDDPEVNPEQVGQRLRLARRRAGFSQQELADALNVGRRTIYEWEIGERIPKKHLTRISQGAGGLAGQATHRPRRLLRRAERASRDAGQIRSRTGRAAPTGQANERKER